ncbi:MAG: hypothetical protein ABSG10_12925, partial [Terracidiphilus sp.]
GQSMTNGRVGALVVTPPSGDKTVTLVITPGETAKVTVQSKPGGVGWTLENLPETGYLLVYGVTAASAVRVNGEDLPKVTTTGFGSMPVGWQADLAGNRLVIRFETRQIEQSASTTTIEVDLNPSEK